MADPTPPEKEEGPFGKHELLGDRVQSASTMALGDSSLLFIAFGNSLVNCVNRDECPFVSLGIIRLYHNLFFFPHTVLAMVSLDF